MILSSEVVPNNSYALLSQQPKISENLCVIFYSHAFLEKFLLYTNPEKTGPSKLYLGKLHCFDLDLVETQIFKKFVFWIYIASDW